MLSINFSTPLAGAARSERIKQMTNNHPAFEKSRQSQEILVKIQTSLRRMPGVSSKESSEIIAQLQEVGQIVSTETSQLVDALMNLTLDQEDTDKAIARMSIEANLAKAEADDQTHNLSNLRVELSNEKEKRQEAEAEVAKVMEELQKLSREIKSLKERSNDGNSDDSKSSPDRDAMVKLGDTIKHLEEQVNSRRSLWVMKNPSSDSVARAIESIAESCSDKDAVQKTIMSLRPDGNGDTNSRDTKSSGPSEVAVQSHRPLSASRFGSHIVPGPSRPTSTAPSERRFGQWAPPTPSQTQSRFGTPSSNGTGPQSLYGRNAPRRAFDNGNYRPNAPEFYPQSYGYPDKSLISPNKGGYGQPRQYYPPTPSGGRNKYSRFRDPVTISAPDYTAPPGVLTTRPPFPGPPIYITDMTITAWHDQFTDLYESIRAFVRNHAEKATFINPTDLSDTRLWPVLVATYHPLSEHEAVSYLDFHLKEASSKSCLVTRVVVDYVVNRVWVPRAWMGAETEATHGLVEVEKELERTQGPLGQPAARRQHILDRQAGIIDSIMKLDGFQEFSKVRCQEISDVILNMIEPLLNPDGDPETIYKELESVASATWALSSRILSSRLTFDFRFPEIGSRYSSQSMMPIWPDFDPQDLQAEHWRVALVTTPVVTCRNDTGSNISAHSVCVADVVCMR
ncbi:chromosome segregation protein smc [Fusarium flagelliforme]|uniref:Chromosome segregation protein smc n=1 Tax=Fusarium flagelliforme TaxID=2675880 RepID=A0A395N5M3_9HYPO|nr:chromosome segregation protein smc [Fusarium flagelliforme]